MKTYVNVLTHKHIFTFKYISFLYIMYSNISNKAPDMNNLKKERFVLAHGLEAAVQGGL